MSDPGETKSRSAGVGLLHDGALVATGDQAIAEAARLLRTGEVVAIPTDTVYGLAAGLDAPGALNEIFRIKGRARDQTLPVLIDDIAMVGRLMANGATVSRAVDRLLSLAIQHWPGGLTVAVPAGPGLAGTAVVASDGTIGLRIPDHRVAQAVIQLAGGALAVTSANRSGQPAGSDPETVLAQLGPGCVGLRWVLAGGPATGGGASTVIGNRGEHLVVHRAGAVDPDTLHRTWDLLRARDDGPVG